MGASRLTVDVLGPLRERHDREDEGVGRVGDPDPFGAGIVELEVVVGKESEGYDEHEGDLLVDARLEDPERAVVVTFVCEQELVRVREAGKAGAERDERLGGRGHAHLRKSTSDGWMTRAVAASAA